MNRTFYPQLLFKTPSVRFPAFFEDLENELSQFANLQNSVQNDVHIETDDRNVYVQVPMPGFDPNDIDITLKNGVIFIKGEKKFEEKKDKEKDKEKSRKIYRQASRLYTFALSLPEQVDENADIKATNENGLLTIELPKTQKGQTKKITVKKK